MVLLRILLLLLLLPSLTFGAEYYASPDGGATKAGTKADPFKLSTITWANLQGADHTLYLMGGTYALDSTIRIYHATTSYRLTIKPCSASPDPTGCDSQVVFTKADSASPTNPDTMVSLAGTNITLSGRGTDTCTPAVPAVTDDPCRNIKFVPGDNHAVALAEGDYAQYLEITGMADYYTTTCGTYCKIKGIQTGLLTDSDISNNYLHDNRGHSDINAAGSSGTYGLIKIHDNVVKAGTINFVSTGRGIDIYNNTFDITGAYIPYDIIHVYRDGLSNIRVYNNTITGDATQVVFLENPFTAAAKTEKVRIYNNTITCLSSGCYISIALHQASSPTISNGLVDDVAIFNNTFNTDTSGTCIRLLTGTGSLSTYTNFKVINNVFYNVNHLVTQTSANSITWVDVINDAIFNNNLVYNSGAWNMQWLDGSRVMTTYTSIPAFITAHSTFTGNAYGDPLFVSASNMTLQATSPAIDHGMDLTALTDIPAFNGVSWPYDQVGTARPQGAAWDIGALEYVYGSPTTYNLTLASAGTGTGTVALSPQGTSCGANCYTYNTGTYITPTETPTTGAFTSWSGACTGSNLTCPFTISGNTTLTAQWDVPTVPPVLSGGWPSGNIPAGYTTFVPYFISDKACTCKFAVTDIAYASMSGTGMGGDGTTTHTLTMTGLTNGTTYDRYFRCQDGGGNTNTTSLHINFQILNPSSSVSTSGKTKVGATGATKVYY